MNKLCCRVEINAHVEGRGIMSLDAMVSDVHALIILCPAPPFVLSAVEDVCDSKLYKLSPV